MIFKIFFDICVKITKIFIKIYDIFTKIGDIITYIIKIFAYIKHIFLQKCSQNYITYTIYIYIIIEITLWKVKQNLYNEGQ